jgi:VWFA-related protein
VKTRGLLAIFVVFSLLAQTPPAVQTSTPVLRSTTRLIQVNLIAQDKKGNPITDLTRDDFVLTDAGKGQKISLFQLEREETAPAIKAAAPKAGDPKVITLSNHVEQSAGAVTVILFDSLNTKFQDQARARTEVIKYLKQASPNNRIALYSLGRQLRILHDFTSSNASLIRALGPSATHPLDSSAADAEPDDPDTGDQNMDDLISWANGQFSDYVNVNRAELTLDALQAIARHVSRIPGRKNFVWISRGFPFSINQDGMDMNSHRDSRNFSEETQKWRGF